MVAFAACLFGAGVLLSILVRVSALAGILVGFCLILAAAMVLGPALGMTFGLPIALLIAVVALQAGYGLAIVVRAVLSSRSGKMLDRADAIDALPQTLPRAHKEGASNHP